MHACLSDLLQPCYSRALSHNQEEV